MSSYQLLANSVAAPPAMEVRAKRSPKEAPNLDILRALAVTLVLLDHILETVGHQQSISFNPIDWYLGRMGVLLFFVHTSLVLMHSMARLDLNGIALFKTFITRRIFRVYPLSILCILLVLTLRVPAVPWSPPFEWYGWRNLLSNLALTMNLTYSAPVLAPMWSLPVELQMYAVLPVLFIGLKRHNNVKIAFLFWCAAALIGLVQPWISGRLTVAYYGPCFASGVIAYSLTARTPARIPGPVWLPFLVCMLGLYILGESMLSGVHHVSVQWTFCLIIGLAIPQFQDSTSPLLNSVTQQVAKYSYGIYLFHCIALWIGCGWLSSAPLVIQWSAVALTLTVLSVAAYHFLEKPAIDLGARLTKSVARESAVHKPSMAAIESSGD